MIATILLSQWHSGPWHSGWSSGWWWIFPLTGTLLFLGTLVVLVWSVIRTRSGSRPNRTGGARQILAERFARGEINEEEYRSRLSQLSDMGVA